MDAENLEGDDMTTEPVHIRSIDIERLFRQYDHHIELRREDRVTIVHGRNGVGKTVTLMLVAALLKGNYLTLTKFPFRRIRIEFTDGSFIQAHRDEDHDESSNEKRTKGRKRGGGPDVDREQSIQISYCLKHGERKSFPVSDSEKRIVAALRDRAWPWIRRVDEDRWHDGRTDELLSTEEIYQRYADALPISRSGRTPEEREARELCKRLPVHFIEAQRLFKISAGMPRYGEGTMVTSAVKDVAVEMARRIKETDSTYRSTSTRLDDSLPARLFAAAPGAQPLPEDELNRRTEALEKERGRLRDIGIISDAGTSFNPNDLDDTRRAMFAVYLNDNEEKLAVFRSLADRAEILLGIINRKFEPKRVQLDKDDGYKAFSHDGQPLDLNLLSSGEQHELVLLHNLLFRVEPGALLLIDEPELSLHVTWQTEFLEDLIAIAKKVGFDVIVATHSPYIVGERRDLMVQLGEPV